MSTIARDSAVYRPTTVTAAVALLALLGAAGLLSAPVGPEGVGGIVIVVALVMAGLRFVAAAGLWRCRRWAAILGFAVSLLDTLLAAPGIAFAPEAMWRVLSTASVVLGVATLVLIVHPASRRAYV